MRMKNNNMVGAATYAVQHTRVCDTLAAFIMAAFMMTLFAVGITACGEADQVCAVGDLVCRGRSPDAAVPSSLDAGEMDAAPVNQDAQSSPDAAPADMGFTLLMDASVPDAEPADTGPTPDAGCTVGATGCTCPRGRPCTELNASCTLHTDGTRTCELPRPVCTSSTGVELGLLDCPCPWGRACADGLECAVDVCRLPVGHPDASVPDATPATDAMSIDSGTPDAGNRQDCEGRTGRCRFGSVAIEWEWNDCIQTAGDNCCERISYDCVEHGFTQCVEEEQGPVCVGRQGQPTDAGVNSDAAPVNPDATPTPDAQAPDAATPDASVPPDSGVEPVTPRSRSFWWSAPDPAQLYAIDPQGQIMAWEMWAQCSRGFTAWQVVALGVRTVPDIAFGVDLFDGEGCVFIVGGYSAPTNDPATPALVWAAAYVPVQGGGNIERIVGHVESLDAVVTTGDNGRGGRNFVGSATTSHSVVTLFP